MVNIARRLDPSGSIDAMIAFLKLEDNVLRKDVSVTYRSLLAMVNEVFLFREKYPVFLSTSGMSGFEEDVQYYLLRELSALFRILKESFATLLTDNNIIAIMNMRTYSFSGKDIDNEQQVFLNHLLSLWDILFGIDSFHYPLTQEKFQTLLECSDLERLANKTQTLYTPAIEEKWREIDLWLAETQKEVASQAMTAAYAAVFALHSISVEVENHCSQWRYPIAMLADSVGSFFPNVRYIAKELNDGNRLLPPAPLNLK